MVCNTKLYGFFIAVKLYLFIRDRRINTCYLLGITSPLKLMGVLLVS